MQRRAFLRHSAALAALPLLPAPALAVRAPRAAPLRVNGARLNGWLAAFTRSGPARGAARGARTARAGAGSSGSAASAAE